MAFHSFSKCAPLLLWVWQRGC